MERTGVAFEAGLQPKETVEVVQYAEELGYDSAWMTEGHAGDQFCVLTACALVTKRIRLGTAVSSVYVRGAPTIAMAAACVDEYSGGRFVLGLGSSHKMQVEGEYGIPYSKPIPRLLEYVDIIRGLIRDARVSYKGDILNIEDFALWFQPLRREIPIYLGAVNPKMLEICGQTAQGVLLVQATLEQIRDSVQYVIAGAKRAGRNPNEIEMAMLMPCSIAKTKKEARNHGRGRLTMYAARFPRYRKMMAAAGYAKELEAVRKAWMEGDREHAQRLVPDELVDRTTLVATSAKECLEQINAYRKVGITLPIISPAMEGTQAKAQAMKILKACAPS